VSIIDTRAHDSQFLPSTVTLLYKCENLIRQEDDSSVLIERVAGDTQLPAAIKIKVVIQALPKPSDHR